MKKSLSVLGLLFLTSTIVAMDYRAPEIDLKDLVKETEEETQARHQDQMRNLRAAQRERLA